MLSIFALSTILSLNIHDSELNFDRLMLAIEEVESPNERRPWSKPGGAANWTPALWHQYSALPYLCARQKESSREAMVNALTDFCHRYIAEGITPTYWRLAMAWNKGYDGAKRARRTKDDYGERVSNLVAAPEWK